MFKFLQAFTTHFNYNLSRMLRETGLKLDAFGSALTHDIGYLEPLSRHRQVMPLYGKVPTFFQNVQLRDNATIIGEVVLGDQVQVGYGSTLKADHATIRVGQKSSIGDNCVLECVWNRLPTGIPHSVFVAIGQNTKIGDNVVLRSCIIDDDVVIGDRCLILEGSQLERGCVILADSVVPPGKLIPAGTVWSGNPVRLLKEQSQQIE